MRGLSKGIIIIIITLSICEEVLGFLFSFFSQLFVVVASSSSNHQGLWVLTNFGQQVIYFDFVDNHRFWFFLSMHFSSNNCWFTGGYLILFFFQKCENHGYVLESVLLFLFLNRGWWTLRTALISVKVLFLSPVLLGTYLVFINNLWFWFLRENLKSKNRRFWSFRTFQELNDLGFGFWFLIFFY